MWYTDGLGKKGTQRWSGDDDDSHPHAVIAEAFTSARVSFGADRGITCFHLTKERELVVRAIQKHQGFYNL